MGIANPAEEYFKDGYWAWDAAGETWVKLACDPATGYLYVDAQTVALPTGAATAAHQLTMITALQLIDDLRNALATVGTDELDVNVDNWPGTPVIYNVTMTSADTEYSQALPANTRKLLIRCRGAYAIKVCFTAEGSGTLYVTVPSGMTYWEDQINDASITLYFQCATAAQVAELVAWS